MKKMNKKRTIAAASGFALLAILAGTFAWFQSSDSETNHFEGQIATGDDIEVVETFTPPTDWEGEVAKKVTIANIGSYDQIVRVTFDESLAKLKDHESKKITTGADLEGKTLVNTYLVPGTALPTSADFTDSTFEGSAPTISVSTGSFTGTYTLKVKENKVTEPITNEITYTYRYVWERNDGKLFHASGITGFDRNDSDEIKIRSGAASLSYVDLDYAAATTGDWTTDPYNPAFTAAGTNAWNVNSMIDNNIQITFNNITDDPTVADKWYFNTADGYFYYTSLVSAGKSTTQIINSVALVGNYDNSYSKLKYDLTVNAKGIQAFHGAVDEWVGTSNPALTAALKTITKEK
jgi:predicted ribosomally synthesized peptide with SipW-like signal peptide